MTKYINQAHSQPDIKIIIKRKGGNKYVAVC